MARRGGGKGHDPVGLKAASIDVQAASVAANAASRKYIALLAVIFLLLLALYVKIAALTTLGPVWYVFDVIERFRVLGVDDVYRFYYARSAWTNSDLYSWSYALPGGVIADGILSSLSGGSAFLMRCAHAFLACLSLFLLHGAGVKSGIGRWHMLVSVLVIALMPLYVLVSLSFLGESWLFFLVSASLFCFVDSRWRLCAIITGLLPLFRPEGIFFLVPIFVFFARKKDWPCVFLLILPGAFYFFYLCFSLDVLFAYGEWRFVLRGLLNLVRDPLVYRIGVFSTFNPVWLLPALGAFFVPRMRPLWPFWTGALLTILLFISLLSLHLANYEPRYLLFIMPLVALAWAMLIEYLTGLKWFFPVRTGMGFLFIVVSVFVVLENLMQLDFLCSRYGGGSRWPIAGISPLPVSFGAYGEERVQQRRNVAEEVERAIARDPGIGAVLVGNPELLLDIDPARIPSSVRVILMQVEYDVAERFLQGDMLGLFPGGSQYAYFHVHPGAASAKGLYIGTMSCAPCKPLRREGEFAVYEVGFDEFRTPASPVFKR